MPVFTEDQFDALYDLERFLNREGFDVRENRLNMNDFAPSMTLYLGGAEYIIYAPAPDEKLYGYAVTDEDGQMLLDDVEFDAVVRFFEQEYENSGYIR